MRKETNFVHQIRSKKVSSLESRKLELTDSKAQISDYNHLQNFAEPFSAMTLPLPLLRARPMQLPLKVCVHFRYDLRH